MKTLSIKQPWAYLIASGLKNIENRSWETSYRGKFLIHASKTMDSRHREMSLLFTRHQWNALGEEEQKKASHGIYDHSSIIGEIEIVDCVQNSSSIWAEAGQWHWVLKNPVLYPNPVKNVKGALSFWNFELPNNFRCESHDVKIQCPECDHIQKAKVEHTVPFATFIHTCEACNYLIMESEWNEIK